MTVMDKKGYLLPVFAAIALGTSYSGAAHAVCVASNPSAAPAAAVLVLLDRSGSMASDGKCTDGSVRRKWECGVNDAHQWIANNDPSQERAYFIWQFSTMAPDPSIVTVQDNGGSNNGYCESDAFTKLTPTGPLVGPLVDDAATPLAGAYCDAVTFLLNYRTRIARPDLQLFIKLESDGLENTTPIGHACQGPDGGSSTFAAHNPVSIDTSVSPPLADGLQVGSWQGFMYDAAITGVPHAFPPLSAAAFQFVPSFPTDLAVITNVSFIDDFIQPAALASRATTTALGTDGLMGAAAFARAALAPSALAGTIPSSVDDLVNFFGGLADASGARLTRFGSGAPMAPGDPHGFHVIAGDVNDSSCVDSADFNALKQVYGQAASAANPNAVLADLSEDGVVNAADYFVLAAHFGQGCVVSPGPVPVLGNVLFGFEDAARWSSAQAALSTTALQHSEGSFSLLVGGTGWREISTAPFATSLFQGVTSKLAFDVRIPANPSNKFWLGQALLFVSSPSAGLFNVPLGTSELTGKPLATFSTATFNIPANVRSAMSSPRSDFSIKIVLNANDPNYQLDNLRFVP